MKSSHSKPTFLRQGLLILLPVVVMASAGLVVLRRDRRAVEHQAQQQASELATALAPEIARSAAWHLEESNAAAPQALSLSLPPLRGGMGEMSTHELAFAADGTLVWPIAVRELYEPPAWFVGMSGLQRAAWEDLRGVLRNGPPEQRAQGIQAFLLTDPPGPAKVAAELIPLAARPEKFLPAARQHPEACVESGLPIPALAFAELVKRPESAEFAEWLDPMLGLLLRSAPANYPELLDKAESRANSDPGALAVTRAYRTIWQAQEQLREVARVVERRFGSGLRAPDGFWVETGSEWVYCAPVASSQPGEPRRMRVLPQNRIEHAFQRGLDAIKLPAYLEGRVTLEGGPPAANHPGEVLAAVRPQLRDRAMPEFTLNLRLVDRPQLLRAYHQRMLLFGGLIVTSALAALAGLFAAWRSFRQQARLNELKSDFVSSVSHELRAPIASVRLMAESLESGKIREPARQGEYFRFISQECGRLSALIENVLDFSRIDQGRKQYEFEPAELSELVRRTVQLLEPYAAERGVSLRIVQAPPTLPAVLDAKAIQQALINLADNAIKHSPRAATVRIGLERDGEDSSAPIRLWVEDDGEGIPPSLHAKIFERFYRVGSELRRQTQGVGIGLSIVRHIVEAHHGTVTVRSEPGKGSRFTITLRQ